MPITVITIWRTRKDSQVCPRCKLLEGYTWTFDAGEPYPKKLVHPLYGPVFDMRPAADCSLVKEKKGHQCRCTLEHRFEVSGIIAEKNNVLVKATIKQPNKKRVKQQYQNTL